MRKIISRGRIEQFAQGIERASKNMEEPRYMESPESMGTGTAFFSVNQKPRRVTGIATSKPAIGPLAPTSNSALRLGIGSLMEINAPIVPNGNIIGGIGKKKGSEASRLCFLA